MCAHARGSTVAAVAATLAAPVPSSFLRNRAPDRRMPRASEDGDPDRDADALTRLSPITCRDRPRAPLLLIQGASDPRVPAGEAIAMHDALAARHIDAPLDVFPDDGHGARRRDDVVLPLGHVLAFFDEHLRGGGAPASRAPSGGAPGPAATSAGAAK